MKIISNTLHFLAGVASVMRRTIICFVILSVFMCAALSACKADEKPATVATVATHSTTPVATSSAQPTTAAPTSASAMTVNCDKSYKAVSATDLDNNNVELSFVFGSGYTQYGGDLTFGADGKFTVWIGVYKAGGSNFGTYTVSSDTSVAMSYGNGQKKTATITATDGTEITSVELEYGGYLVTFSL